MMRFDFEIGFRVANFIFLEYTLYIKTKLFKAIFNFTLLKVNNVHFISETTIKQPIVKGKMSPYYTFLTAPRSLKANNKETAIAIETKKSLLTKNLLTSNCSLSEKKLSFSSNSTLFNQESLSLNKTASAMNDADSVWTAKSQPMKENIIKSDLSLSLKSTTSNPKSFLLNKTISAFKDADSVMISKSQQGLISENGSNVTLATDSCISNQEMSLNKTASAMNDADSVWTSKSQQSEKSLKKSNDFKCTNSIRSSLVSVSSNLMNNNGVNSVFISESIQTLKNYDFSTQLNRMVRKFSDF